MMRVYVVAKNAKIRSLVASNVTADYAHRLCLALNGLQSVETAYMQGEPLPRPQNLWEPRMR